MACKNENKKRIHKHTGGKYDDNICRRNCKKRYYTSNKTERGIIKDVARVVSKYDQSEANTLLDYLKMGLNKYNTPFAKASESEGGYFFEYEEVPCATRYNEETDEMKYKEGYYNYFCIRIVK